MPERKRLSQVLKQMLNKTKIKQSVNSNLLFLSDVMLVTSSSLLFLPSNKPFFPKGKKNKLLLQSKLTTSLEFVLVLTSSYF